MSFNLEPKQYTDKFGNPTSLTALTQVVDKKSGELLPIFKGYFESNGQLYKLELSNSNKESKSGLPQKWCKITKVKKKAVSTGKF
ncbi:MAG: hypothetical protein HYR91_06215 [Flavobacteriia bacterium]|nr:hypothetical protein [Flavobacteriia bacterium]